MTGSRIMAALAVSTGHRISQKSATGQGAKAPWSKGPSTPTDAIDRTTTIGHRTRAHDRTSHRRGTTHDATLRYTDGLAVDHRICGSRVNSHRRDERGDGESREYEQAHGRLHLWLIGVNLTLVGLVVDRAWMRVQLALR
jgi:hypothetical protein